MRDRAIRRRRKISWHEMTQDKAFWLFAIFAGFVFFIGGGARHDIASVGPLRAVSAIVLAVGVYFQTAQTFRRVGAWVLLILALGLWMAIQLIPLPPIWWSLLHGREAIVEAGELIGLKDVWRPITLSPLKTYNALASLVVPLAALMLLALLDESCWRRVRMVIIVAGITSALLGIAQVTLRGSPGLYLYEITNSASAVGLFSNRNHNALLLNIALLFAVFHRDASMRVSWRPADLLILVGQIVILLAILINGSRLGIILLAIVGFIFTLRCIRDARGSKAGGEIGHGRLISGVLVGVFSAGLIAVFAIAGRLPALQRLIQKDIAEDQRGETLPTITEMALDHFPFGAGFGTFEQAYRMVEPEELLSSFYLNHAHNDWLQIVVEGGLPATVLLAIVLLLLLKRALFLWKIKASRSLNLFALLLGFITLLFFGLHSVVDYPLRTPSLMLVAAVALGMLGRPCSGFRADWRLRSIQLSTKRAKQGKSLHT